MRDLNRKLLVSVFSAQEAREAVLGGGRIVDSEDPKSALGNISPRHIMDISDAVLDFTRDLDVQLSTNIGEDQLLFRRSQDGRAIEKSPYEIAGKAAQAAIGVACAMGTHVHPVNLVKVGLDGMETDKIGEVLSEVVSTLRRTEHFSHTQVMSVLFAQSLPLWEERRQSDNVRRTLVGLREFDPTDQADPKGFDLQDYAVGTLRDRRGEILFTDRSQVSLATLIRSGVLPQGANSTTVCTNELFAQTRYFPAAKMPDRRTSRDVIAAMVDVTAESGADAIMIDTSILSKVSNICLVDTAGSEMVNINAVVARDGLPLRGILPLDDLRFFVDYCHYRGIAANAAGSIESFQVQQLWTLLPALDQASTRGAASGVAADPSGVTQEGSDTRQYRVIKRSLVRGLAPPEHGGVLNLPVALKTQAGAQETIRALLASIGDVRQKLGLPPLKSFWVDRYGDPKPVEL